MKLVVHHIPPGQDEATPDRSINRRSEGRTASIDSLPRDYWGEDRQGDHIDLWNGSRLTHLRFIALENLARWCCQAGVRRALDQHLVQWCLPVTPSKWNPVTPLRAKLDGEAGISATRLWALTKRFNRSKRYDRPRPATEFPLRVGSGSHRVDVPDRIAHSAGISKARKMNPVLSRSGAVFHSFVRTARCDSVGTGAIGCTQPTQKADRHEEQPRRWKTSAARSTPRTTARRPSESIPSLEAR